MDDILSDQNKFSNVNLKDDTSWNFVVNQEKRVGMVLEKLVESNSMTEKKQEIVKTSRFQTRCYVRFM